MKSNILHQSISSFRFLLTREQKGRGVFILSAFCFIALLDVLGLGLIIPAIMTALNKDFIRNNEILNGIYQWGGFQDETVFLLAFLSSLLLFIILKNMAGIRVSYLLTRYAAGVSTCISQKQYSLFFENGYRILNEKGSSYPVNQIIDIPLIYSSSILMAFVNLFSEMVLMLIILSGIIIYDPALFFMLAGILGPFFFLINRVTRGMAAKYGNLSNQMTVETHRSLYQGIQGFTDVKLTGKDSFFIEKFLEKQAAQVRYSFMNTFILQIPFRANEVVAVLGIILIILYSLFFGRSGNLMVNLGLFAAAAYRLLPSMNRILTGLMTMKGAQHAIETLRPVFDYRKRQESHEKIRFDDEISLENVGFHYPGQPKGLLEGVNLRVKKGDTIGFVGESGAGKSTLLKLLLGFEKPVSGRIAVDGSPLTPANMVSWRSLIGYVKQDIFILDGTLRENIAFGQEGGEVDEDWLRECVGQASLSGFVAELPDGFETQMGELGSKISGGQKQRIAIARALYKKSEILVFDEATSALDANTEMDILSSIEKLSGEITIIMITHRLSTLKLCNRIFELKNGRVSPEMDYPALIGRRTEVNN